MANMILQRNGALALLLLLWIIQLSMNDVVADTLYVTAGYTGQACTELDPCGTIQSAINVASSGDIINVTRGKYYENIYFGTESTASDKSNIKLVGAGDSHTEVISIGGIDGVERPMGIGADIVMDVWYSNIQVAKMSFIHPELYKDTLETMNVTKRDIGIFVNPTAIGFSLYNCTVERDRYVPNLEPTDPGSRGLLISEATDANITWNTFQGNYQDHIYLSTSNSYIHHNTAHRATRLGIVIIKETSNVDNGNHIIRKNSIIDSASDGIQIQTSNNRITKNIALGNMGAGIKLCGINTKGDCIMPYDDWAQADNNILQKNQVDNNVGGDIVNNGQNNNITKGKPIEDPEDSDPSFDDFPTPPPTNATQPPTDISSATMMSLMHAILVVAGSITLFVFL